MSAVATRPRISAEFLRQNTCERIIAGTAKVIASDGYQGASVTNIVKACGVGRKTFYECYGGKEEAALALVAALELDIEELSETPSIDVFLIEVAAMMYHAGEVERVSEYLSGAEKAIRFFAEADLAASPSDEEGEELERTLRPGRHGLSPEFIRRNQRTRLLTGGVAAIVDRGFAAARISDVCARASVSRRTFYEHFDDLGDLAAALVAEELPTTMLDGLNTHSGLFAMVIEILAERSNDGDPSATAGKALGAVHALTTAFEGGR